MDYQSMLNRLSKVSAVLDFEGNRADLTFEEGVFTPDEENTLRICLVGKILRVMNEAIDDLEELEGAA